MSQGRFIFSNAATGDDTVMLHGHSGMIVGMVLRPDGTVVSRARSHRAEWDLATGKEKRRVPVELMQFWMNADTLDRRWPRRLSATRSSIHVDLTWA